jgi:hypothetical protein
VRIVFSSRAFSLCAAFSLRKPFWKTRDLYSRAFFCAQRFLFARHSQKLAISIRTSSFVRIIFYSRAILKSSRSLFARLSLSAASCFFWVCPGENINCSSLHLPAIVHGGERYFVSRRPSVSWIFGPKTFYLTNQLFGLGATNQRVENQSFFWTKCNKLFWKCVFFCNVNVSTTSFLALTFLGFVHVNLKNFFFWCSDNSTVLSGCFFPLCLLWVFEDIGHMTPNNYFPVRLRFILRSAKIVAAPLCTPSHPILLTLR